MATMRELIAANTTFSAEQLELIRDCLCVASERPPKNSGKPMKLDDRAKWEAHELYLIVEPLTWGTFRSEAFLPDQSARLLGLDV